LYHIGHLTDDVVGLSILGVGNDLVANDDVGLEDLFHHIVGKIIDDSPVEEELPVNFYRLENERKGHGSPDGFAQVATPQHHLLVAVHLGGYTPEGNH